MPDAAETARVLRDYADAWLAADLERVLGAYHEDVVLQYMGESPLAGTHTGRDAVFAALGQASHRSGRRLIAIEDVLAGAGLGDPRDRGPRRPAAPRAPRARLPRAGRAARGVLALRRGPAVHRRAVVGAVMPGARPHVPAGSRVQPA